MMLLISLPMLPPGLEAVVVFVVTTVHGYRNLPQDIFGFIGASDFIRHLLLAQGPSCCFRRRAYWYFSVGGSWPPCSATDRSDYNYG